MKLRFLFCIFFLGVFSSVSAKDLTIYTYSSFDSEWGPGPKVFPLFESQCSCKLKVVAQEDTGQLFAKLLFEKEKTKADIVLGLNDTHLAQLKQMTIFASYQGKNYDKLPAQFQLDKNRYFIPFDYGNLAFIYDSQKIQNPPKSLEDLTHPRFRNKIVIQSPTTSAPGLSFLFWTIQSYGKEGYLDYWQRLSPNLLSITNNWSTAYGMFTKGETPLVLSYATSPAYHLFAESSEKYQAALFPEGHYPQIELAVILKKKKEQKLAQQFIDFMLTKDFQNIIPTTNWMYPVIAYQKLPDAYRIAPRPKTLPLLNRQPQDTKKWLRLWSQEIRKRK